MEELRQSEELTPDHRFFAVYACEDPLSANRLTGLQFVLRNMALDDPLAAKASEIQLRPIGPLNGACKGQRIAFQDTEISQIWTTHTPMGISGFTLVANEELRLGNVASSSSSTLSSNDEETRPIKPKITEWTFSETEAEKVFVGVEAWQTATAIQALSVIEMDLKCIKHSAKNSQGPAEIDENFTGASTSGKVTKSEPSSSNNKKNQPKSPSNEQVTILIALIASSVLLAVTTLICCLCCH